MTNTAVSAEKLRVVLHQLSSSCAWYVHRLWHSEILLKLKNISTLLWLDNLYNFCLNVIVPILSLFMYLCIYWLKYLTFVKIMDECFYTSSMRCLHRVHKCLCWRMNVFFFLNEMFWNDLCVVCIRK